VNQGAVMEALGLRRGDLVACSPTPRRVRLDYRIPARALIGFQSEFLTMTRGTGVMSHVFDDSADEADIAERRNGVLVSAENGEAVAYALWKLQEAPHVREARRSAVRRHHHRHPQPRQRPRRESDQRQAAHERPRLRHGRGRAAGAADQVTLEFGDRVHRRRRARGDHAEIDTHPQALLQEHERKRASRAAA